MRGVRKLAVLFVVVLLATVLLSTPASAVAIPKSLKAIAATTTTLKLDWRSVSKAPQYRVQYSTSPRLSRPTTVRFSKSAGTIKGLKPDTCPRLTDWDQLAKATDPILQAYAWVFRGCPTATAGQQAPVTVSNKMFPKHLDAHRSRCNSAVVFIPLTLVVSGAWADHRDDRDQYSTFTRHQLRTDWTKTELFPLLVPLHIPLQRTSGDAPGFTLENVAVDPAELPSQRVWLSFYDSDALGEGVAVRVFQRPAGIKTTHPCGAIKDQFHLDRIIAGAGVTICSKDLEHNAAARRYWESVVFTADLGRVHWLTN